jgi:hypothetical protein
MPMAPAAGAIVAASISSATAVGTTAYMASQGGSSQSSKTQIPPPTEQETALMNSVLQDFLPAYMEQAGYNVVARDQTFEESDQYKKLNAEIQRAQEQLDYNIKGGNDAGTISGLRDAVNKAKDNLEQARAGYVPVTKYDVSKKESAYVEAIKTKYGADSQEYKDASEKAKTEEISKQANLEEIQKTFIEKTKKFLNGDFSITEDQKKYVQDLYAPIKASVEKMTSDDLAETEKKWTAFRDAVKDTNLSVSQALDVVGTQIKQTGSDMKEALDTTIATNKALMKMGIEDATGTITKKTNQLAASLGRSPSDPEFEKEIQTSVAREVERGTLNLADMQARGELSIAERTGSGLENVAQQRVSLAGSTGQKLEGAAVSEGGEKQNIVTRAGQMRTSIAENTKNMEYQMGAGIVPQQISTGIGTTQFDQALIQQRMANAGAAMNGVTGVYNTMSRDRYAQPMQESNRPYSAMDYMGNILGSANMGMGMYSGIAQADAMRNYSYQGYNNPNFQGSPGGSFDTSSGYVG